jgi:hypothetical protein
VADPTLKEDGVSDPTREHASIIAEFAGLTADLVGVPDAASDQLRRVIVSALRRQLRLGVPAVVPRKLPMVAPEAVRRWLVDALDEEPGGADEAALVVRRDAREALLAGRLLDGLTGLAPSERLGPFRAHGDIDVWFDVFPAVAGQWQIREAGNPTTPAMVLTRAQPPEIGPQRTTVEVEAGTVWIRGDLVDGGLSAGAFVGVQVTGGTLTLDGAVTVVGDVVDASAPLAAVLRVQPAPDEATSAGGGCGSANASNRLPGTLSVSIRSGAATIDGDSGGAEVWGQRFEFGQTTGRRTFVERLWTLVIGYEVNPQPFDPDPIGDELVRFSGSGTVTGGGLCLPVVVAADPTILGETTTPASWALLVEGLTARWYGPDPREHVLPEAWIAIAVAGASIVADRIAPLAAALTHTYHLWRIAGGGTQRLPWRQTYDEDFWLLYRCDVATGEYLMVPGSTTVALDRPVTTNGVPVTTSAGPGALLLHRVGHTVTARLAAAVTDDRGMLQFALRNALVWTTAPELVYVQGTLSGIGRIDAGQAQLAFGVYAWAPTLPDPYVSNAAIKRPQSDTPQAILLCQVTWNAPATVAVSFEGQLGTGLAVAGRPGSAGEPRPGPKEDIDVGLTQSEQGRLSLDRKTQAQWQAARDRAAQQRQQRVADAARTDTQSVRIVDNYLAEVLGPVPNLLLLDVSTNQDLLGVAVGGGPAHDHTEGPAAPGGFPVTDLAVHSQVAGMRVVALPQVQWEPVRTLDVDQDIMTMGWFPTPLTSATDGGAAQIGARSQRLAPVIPRDALDGTFDAFQDGTTVGVRTTFPFGLIAAIALQPTDAPQRPADRYQLTRPSFPGEQSTGGIQVTAHAEGGRPDKGGISPTFQGRMRQLLNGIDLASGAPEGLSVLGETLQPAGSVETIFNNDMAARPRVPVTRIDLSGYGGSNFSDWNNPFAAFAEAAKVQFRLVVGRTGLEVIKVNSVLHPWGVRVTRSVTIERRPGGGVIRRDSGWQAFTPGLFDYRYFDVGVGNIVVAPYRFDAGVFRGLFDVRTIRPAPGTIFAHGTAQLVPYYFDADVAFDGAPGRTAARGILGYLQVAPTGLPADEDALRALVQTQGPIGGPVDRWLDFGGSGLPFRAQRVEVGLALDGGNPLFVATVRGMPKLPETGAWSVVVRPVAGVPADGGEAVPVTENRGVPLVRRYPVAYQPGDDTVFTEPPLAGATGPHRFADAADLLTPAAPVNDYALLQSAPTHAFLFPRPSVPTAGTPRIDSGHKPALADILARSTSKGAFPPPGNTLELAAGSLHFAVGATGKLALSAPVTITNHPTPLRLAGSTGHGSTLFYDVASLRLDLGEDRWAVEFTGLQLWTDVAGLARLTGSELKIVGGTDQRPQIAELRSLLLREIEEILRYIPLFGDRGVQGPIELGASNARHEIKFEAKKEVTIPPAVVSLPFGLKLTLSLGASTGIDLATGGPKSSAVIGVALEGKIPLVGAFFLIVTAKVTFSLTSVSGSVTAERLELLAFVGVGIQGTIGGFEAYAYFGVGFVLSYDALANKTKYGGLVALEASVNLKVVGVKIRAELKGLVYDDGGATKCDYTGSVKIQVDIFLIISISASYQVSDTTTF